MGPTEFRKNRTKWDGLDSKCKACVTERYITNAKRLLPKVSSCRDTIYKH